MAGDLVCDGCGAMLPSPDSAGLSHCMSCGRVNHIDIEPSEPKPSKGWTAPPTGWTAPPTIQSDVPAAESDVPPSTWLPDEGRPQVVWQTTTADTRTRKRKGVAFWLGCLPVLGIMVGSLAIGGVAIFKAVDTSTNGLLSGNKALNLYPTGGSVLVLPGEPSGTVELITVATDNDDDSARKLVRVSVGAGADETVRWKSAPLPSDAYRAEYAVDGDTLYVGFGSEVRALSLKTGEQAWTASTTDKVSTGCPASCFAVVGGTLVVRTDDAYVTGYQATSTEPRWSYRLRSVAGQFSVVDDQLLVVDDAEVAGDPTVALRIDPATGTVAGTASPACAEREADPYIPFGVDLDTNTPIRAVPGTGDAVAVFGSGYGCVARWEVATGAVRWTVPIESGSTIDRDAEPVLTETDLLIALQSETTAGIRIDLATGARTNLEPLADATAVPRAVVDGIVIGETTTSRGTTKGGLAGWDLATGARRWSATIPGQTEPVSTGAFHSSDSLFAGSARTLVLPGAAARLVTFDSDRKVTVQAIDAATGELGAKATGSLPSRYSSSGTASLTVESVRGDRVVITIDSLIAAVDLSGTGEVDVRRWPPS